MTKPGSFYFGFVYLCVNDEINPVFNFLKCIRYYNFLYCKPSLNRLYLREERGGTWDFLIISIKKWNLPLL